jgi:hypothetical protein
MVNPSISCTVRRSSGNTIAEDGTRVPSYEVFPGVVCQIQPLSNADIRRIGALNIQPNMKAIYVNGELDVLVRSAMKGGDLITQPNNTVWLVTQSLEDWDQSGWCKVSVVLQNGK